MNLLNKDQKNPQTINVFGKYSKTDQGNLRKL